VVSCFEEPLRRLFFFACVVERKRDEGDRFGEKIMGGDSVGGNSHKEHRDTQRGALLNCRAGMVANLPAGDTPNDFDEPYGAKVSLRAASLNHSRPTGNVNEGSADLFQ
jgi:hypothetical protein